MPALPSFAPLPVYRSRLSRLRREMALQSLGALLITCPQDVRYLTPFVGDDSYALVTESQLWVISDFRYQEELGTLRGYAKVALRKGDIAEEVARLVASLKIRELAFQGEHMSVAGKARLGKLLAPCRLTSTAGILSALRQIKDKAEVGFIEKAVAIQEAALLATLPTIRPGQSESHIAARLEFEMKQRGSHKPAFDTIVAAGANGSKPHYTPASAKTARGRPLLIDWGARVAGYCSDMTRTFTLGKWHPRMAEIYQIVLDAHLAALDALAPGKTCAEADGVARDIIKKSGYGEQFGHGLGHGIGLHIHENPRLHHTATGTVLQEGMVVTVEPGIYLPGLGGVRIEDDALITKRGARGLCTLPKTLKWATL